GTGASARGCEARFYPDRLPGSTPAGAGRALAATRARRSASGWIGKLRGHHQRALPMSRRYLQLDVFADRPGAGNPLAVVLDADGLDETTMQAIARWTRLPETTFVFAPPSAEASYGLRMFSPQREVPFAGHPSVGTAHAVLAAGLALPQAGLLVQEGVAGQLPLRVRGSGATRTIAVRTPRARVVEVADTDDDRLADALAGLARGALPVALMDGGRRWWLAELADEATLRGASP